MKHGRDGSQDPSDPINEYHPFATLPLDVIYKLFVFSSNTTVQDVKRLCSTDTRIRNVCNNEFIWRKLYFLKVVKDRILPTLSDHDGEDRRYVDTVLMSTPEGVVWTSQIGFADTPYMLLVALAWRHLLYQWPTSDNRQENVIVWYKEDQYMFRMDANRVGIQAQGYPRNAPSFPELRRVGFAESDAQTSHDRCVFFICLLLREGFVPRRTAYYNSRLPLSLTQNCISCKAKAPLKQCGNGCGFAVYCGQACADNHWPEHEQECTKL